MGASARGHPRSRSRVSSGKWIPAPGVPLPSRAGRHAGAARGAPAHARPDRCGAGDRLPRAAVHRTHRVCSRSRTDGGAVARGRRTAGRRGARRRAVGVVPSRRAGGGIHLFHRDGRVTGARGGSSCRRRCSCCALVWLVVYPLVLVLLEGAARTRRGGRSSIVRLFLATSHGMAGALGQPLDLGRERRAGRRSSASRSRSSSRATTFPASRLLGALVALPAVLPPLVGVLAFLFLYGETGFVSLAGPAAVRPGATPPWRLQGAGAILLVHAYSMYVYFYLFARAALAVARRLAARGGREPRRRTVANASAGGPAAALSGARRRRAPHVHDRRSPRSARPTSSAAGSGS